jgi:hypothetical protein
MPTKRLFIKRIHAINIKPPVKEAYIGTIKSDVHYFYYVQLRDMVAKNGSRLGAVLVSKFDL